MKKICIFLLSSIPFFTLQCMEQPLTGIVTKQQDDPLHDIAQKLTELVKKIPSTSAYGSSLSPTIKEKKYKEVTDANGITSNKTYAIYPTDIPDITHEVNIIKAPINDQTIYTINSPYFEKIATIQTQKFNDDTQVNESLKELVTLLHQFQAETASLSEIELLTHYKVACKINTADVIPWIRGKIILPELSPKTSPQPSPQSSPSPKSKKKLGKKLSQSFLQKLALAVKKKP